MKTLLQRLKKTVGTFTSGLREGSAVNRVFMSISPLKFAALLLGGIIFVWVLTWVWNRAIVEKANATVEIALDFDEVVDLCQRNEYDLAAFLVRCRTIGVTGMVINEETLATWTRSGKISVDNYMGQAAGDNRYYGPSLRTDDADLSCRLRQQFALRYHIDTQQSSQGKRSSLATIFNTPFTPAVWEPDLPLGFSRDKIRFLSRLDYHAVLRPQNSGKPLWIFENMPFDCSGIIIDGREVPGYPGDERDFGDAIKDNNVKTIVMEFVNPAGIDQLKRTVPSSVVLGHVIASRELNTNPGPDAWIARWRRAVRERGARFLLFNFWDGRSVDENMGYLRKLAVALKKDGFVLDQAAAPEYPAGENYRLRLVLVFALAVIVPLIAVYSGVRRVHPLLGYGIVNVISLAGGCAVAALLFDVVFMQKIIEIPFVKSVMLAPVLLAGIMLYEHHEWRRFWLSEIRVMHVAALVLVCAAGLLLFVRSGNNSAAWLQPDHALRQFLENLLIIRPRTKEFLFGQPLLLLGLYYRKKGLLWLGIIGQASILNTFLHAHTPVVVSLVRTLHGIWLGLVVGGVLVILINTLRGRMRGCR